MWGSHRLSTEPMTDTAIIQTDAAAPERPSATIYVVGEPKGVYVSVLKPLFDRLVALVVLLVTLPIMILCAIAVRISLGPRIFFTQERVGRDGRRFYVYKFRTMHHDRRARRDDFGARRTRASTTPGSRPSAASCASGASTSSRSCGTCCVAT